MKELKHIKSYKIFEKEKHSERVISAKDLLKKDFDKGLDLEGKYKILFEKPAPNFSMMLFGQPGSGKTFFALQFANYLTKFGKVLYISSEEYNSITLQNKVKEIILNDEENPNELKKEDIEIPDNLYFAKGMVDLEGYDFIFIDSVNDLNLDIMDYKEIRDIYDEAAFISILQSIKGEKPRSFRGGKDWEHEMDIAAEVDDGVVDVYKNRYSDVEGMGTYDIFNNKIVNKDKD